MSTSEPFSALRSLLNSRYVGVLATTNGTQPYPALVGYATSRDIKELTFATPRQTRKYAHLQSNPEVAMLFDDRSNDAADIMNAVAATAIGRAAELHGNQRDAYLQAYVARHPDLCDFARATSTALFRIQVHKYILVRRFQNVIEIVP